MSDGLRPADPGGLGPFPWPPVILAATLMGAFAAQQIYPIAWPGDSGTLAHYFGLSFLPFGLAIIAWAVITLRRHETTFLPHKSADRLVTTGPYGFVRNPIYAGEAIALLGVGELTRNIWFVIAVLPFGIAITYLAIKPEERHLEAKFGDAYRKYKAIVGRWI